MRARTAVFAIRSETSAAPPRQFWFSSRNIGLRLIQRFQSPLGASRSSAGEEVRGEEGIVRHQLDTNVFQLEVPPVIIWTSRRACCERFDSAGSRQLSHRGGIVPRGLRSQSLRWNSNPRCPGARPGKKPITGPVAKENENRHRIRNHTWLTTSRSFTMRSLVSMMLGKL